MKNKRQIIFLMIGLVGILVIFGVLIFWLKASEKTPVNPAGTVGNSAGNLNNSGLFCEYNGRVYFSNAFDGGSLYSMKPDESDIRQLNHLNVRNLLAGGDYLYYYQEGSGNTSGGNFAAFAQLPGMKSFSRCDLNGKDATTLVRDYVFCAQLVNNSLYLMASGEAPSFYQTDLNGNNQVILGDYYVNPACAENGTIYYNGTLNNHYLYALDTRTNVARELWQGNIWYPVIDGDYVYYLDVANDYRLCRYSLSEHLIEVLTHDRVDCFNLGQGYIYYQKNSTSHPQLICMGTDGSSPTVVAEGNYTRIHMTSKYVYFQAFGNDNTWYHCPIGSNQYEEFTGARSAAGK